MFRNYLEKKKRDSRIRSRCCLEGVAKAHGEGEMRGEAVGPAVERARTAA